MLVLGIDTSSAVVACALGDGVGVLGSSARPGVQAHGELLAPAIVAALGPRSPQELTHVVVGVGPGPFTGLRVGVVTGLVLGEALGIPVLGVCSLDVVAAAAVAHVGEPFAVVTDARRKEVYVARYDETGRRLGAPYVARPGDLDDDVRHGPVVGPGAGLYREHFPDVRSADALQAPVLAAVAAAVALGSQHYEALAPEPLYLRRPDAVENAARKRVTPA